ncbi:MAG: hypothetical protein ACOY82_08495 [Pseudomonadota bacterium]
MSVMPLRWQSVSRMERVRELALERTERWIAQWCAPGQCPTVEVDLTTAQRPEIAAADVRWYALRDGDATLCLRTVGATFDHLGCRLAGPATADASGLAAGIGQRAIAELARAFFAPGAPATLSPVPGVPAAAEIGVRFGAIGVQIAIGTIRFELHFDAGLCARLSPAQAPAAEKLVARRDAVKTVEGTFEAVLDLGSAPLADSLAFRPGDIVKTSIPIGAPLRLVAGDGGEILSGVLVAEDGRRALRVVKSNFQRNPKP